MSRGLDEKIHGHKGTPATVACAHDPLPASLPGVRRFLMANEYDLGNSAATVAFYRKKIKPLLAWAEREGKGELNAQTLREFFHHLKTKGLTDNGRHASYRAIRTWLNFPVRRKIIRDYEGRVPRERGRYPPGTLCPRPAREVECWRLDVLRVWRDQLY